MILIAKGLMLAAAFVGMTGVMFYGADKQDEVRCHQLKEQSVEFAPHFYLTEWEKQMCDEQGIEINSPVK